MSEERAKFSGDNAARADIGASRSKPAWLESQHSLPFHMLSPDEFEIFCYLLLRRENPDEDIFYYGKTGDAGRDIVRVSSGGHIELIQCKRYQNNVGLPEIRNEFAKLYANIHNHILLERPSRVTFYVVPDVTAPAQDLINQPQKWIETAESTLKDYLKEEPSEELLNLALTWRPQFYKETAIDLTQRALRHQALIDEFFAIRKVVDAEVTNKELNEIRGILEQMQKNQEIILQPSSPNASAALQDILRKAGEENPGIIFTVSHTSQAATITLSANPAVGAVDLATLIFPNTETGNQGLQKFKLLTEEGRAIELAANEYEWRWAFNLPKIGATPQNLKTLKLHPNIPNVRVPSRVEVVQVQEVVSIVNFTYCHLVRAGTKEIECLLEGGQLQGTLRFIFQLEDSKTIVNYSSLELPAMSAKQAKASIDLIRSLHRSTKIQIVSLEDEAILIYSAEPIGKDSNFSEEEFENTLKFLDCLVKINQTFGLDIRYPENIDPEIVKTAKLVTHAIEHGQIDQPGGTITLTYTPQQALEFLEPFSEEETFDLHLSVEVEYSLLGHTLNMGQTETTIKNAFPADDLSLLKQEIAAHPELEKIDIRLQYESMVEKYCRWSAQKEEGKQ